MFFDSGFLTLGNILFFIGTLLIIGPEKSLVFFLKSKKIAASFFFFTGIILILIKKPFIGFLIECFGFLGLFGSCLGITVQFLRSLPYSGVILNHPLISPTINRLAGVKTLPI